MADRNTEIVDLYREEITKRLFRVFEEELAKRKVDGDWYLFEPGDDSPNEFIFLEQPYKAGLLKERLLDEGLDPVEYMRYSGWKVTSVEIYRKE